jgi:hypothetical protein
VGGIIRNNAGVKEYGVLLTFTLKAFPKFGLDLNFDPSGNKPVEQPVISSERTQIANHKSTWISQLLALGMSAS